MATERATTEEATGRVTDVPDGRVGLFGSLCGLVFLVNLARVVFAPLLDPLQAEFVLSEAGTGLIATLAWLGSALPRLPTGYLLTRIDRHRIVLGAGLVLAGAGAFTATAGSALVLYAGALTMGLASGAYFIAANPLVSELFPDGVGKAIGVHGFASQLAAAGAPLFVGTLLAVADWSAVFWLISGGALLVTLAIYLAARRADLPTAGRADTDFFGAFRDQWRIVLTGIAIIGLTGFVWNGLFNFYPKYLVEAKLLAPGTANTLLTVVFAAGVPAFLLTGRLADRISYVPLLLSILVAFVASVLALTLLEGVLALAAISAMLGYVIHSLFPAIDTYLLDSLPDRHRGSAYAVYSATMMLVQATGSVVVGLLRDAGLSYDAVFQGLAGGLSVVIVALVALHLRGRIPTGARPG